MTVEGDIDLNGTPDVTLRSALRRPRQGRLEPPGLVISSSRNRLHALALQGFGNAVSFEPPRTTEALTSHLTFTGNVVSGLVIRDALRGINIYGEDSDSCGLPKPQPCRTYYRWTKTTLTGNTIEAVHDGIKLDLRDSLGDRIEQIAITGNVIRLGENASPGEVDVGIQVSQGGNSTQDRPGCPIAAGRSMADTTGRGRS